MADRPEEFPEWALVEETDPVSGQSNIVEPPESYKNSGWTRAQIPPRQWFNWLLRRIYDWLFYLDFQDSEIRREENEKYARLITRNWFQSEQPSGTLAFSDKERYPICWGPNGFVAVFTSPESSHPSVISETGISWSTTGGVDDGFDWSAVTHSDRLSKYIVVGEGGSVPGDSYSSDGETWAASDFMTGSANFQPRYITDADFGGTGYLMVAGTHSTGYPQMAWSNWDGVSLDIPWTFYEVGSGYADIVCTPTMKTNADGELIAATVDSGGTGDVIILGFTGPETYSQIGSFSSPDIVSDTIGAVVAMEYDEQRGIYTLMIHENPGAGSLIALYTSEDLTAWDKIAEFSDGNPTTGKLLYIEELRVMIITIGAGDLYATTDYENIPRLNWTPGGDAAYPVVAWSPANKSLVAIKAGDSTTDTLTLRSL